jgi:hypothetical protein
MRLPYAGLLLLALVTGAGAHSWYPPSCCSDRDCYAIETDQLIELADGSWKYLPTGAVFAKEKVPVTGQQVPRLYLANVGSSVLRLHSARVLTMWILVLSFVALQAPPPGILVQYDFLTIGECHAAGEAKAKEIRETYQGQLIAHFQCLRGV